MDYRKWQLITIILIIVAGIGFISAAFFFAQNRSNSEKVKRLSQTPEGSNQEVRELVAEVEKIIRLPEGEEPTVATVTDASKLQTQEFFKNAKNGDKVLMYQKAQMAYLYDPIAKRIIDISAFNVASDSAQTATQSASITP